MHGPNAQGGRYWAVRAIWCGRMYIHDNPRRQAAAARAIAAHKISYAFEAYKQCRALDDLRPCDPLARATYSNSCAHRQTPASANSPRQDGRDLNCQQWPQLEPSQQI